MDIEYRDLLEYLETKLFNGSPCFSFIAEDQSKLERGKEIIVGKNASKNALKRS